MNKRMMAVGAAGLLAGAALVAVPGFALASQQSPTPAPSASSSEMGQMMTDAESRQQMKDAMSEMMSDTVLREQMRSMMSDVMDGMGGMGGMGGMEGMGDGGSGEMPTMEDTQP